MIGTASKRTSGKILARAEVAKKRIVERKGAMVSCHRRINYLVTHVGFF